MPIKALLSLTRSLEVGGGKETRTPDIKLAKLALYQLSYTPARGNEKIQKLNYALRVLNLQKGCERFRGSHT
jgi:hypothetical protein